MYQISRQLEEPVTKWIVKHCVKTRRKNNSLFNMYFSSFFEICFTEKGQYPPRFLFLKSNSRLSSATIVHRSLDVVLDT